MEQAQDAESIAQELKGWCLRARSLSVTLQQGRDLETWLHTPLAQLGRADSRDAVLGRAPLLVAQADLLQDVAQSLRGAAAQLEEDTGKRHLWLRTADSLHVNLTLSQLAAMIREVYDEAISSQDKQMNLLLRECFVLNMGASAGSPLSTSQCQRSFELLFPLTCSSDQLQSTLHLCVSRMRDKAAGDAGATPLYEAFQDAFGQVQSKLQKRSTAAKKKRVEVFQPPLAMDVAMEAMPRPPGLFLDERMWEPWSRVLPPPSAEAYGTPHSNDVFFVCRMDA